MKHKLRDYLKEDIGSGDITSELVVPASDNAKGYITCKEDCVLAGVSEAIEVFRELGASATAKRADGDGVNKGDVVIEVEGTARALLAGERLALNIVMRMSGIATITRSLVEKCRGINPGVRVAATRKTTPGFRDLEKKAVLIGGGDPHRHGLYDQVLIKNNHIKVAGGVREALRRAKKGSFTKKIEIEVSSREEALAASEEGADIIMLDNFNPDQAKRLADELRARRPGILIEVSGGIKPENIERYAEAADIISLGSLTHSFKSVDFSMRIEKAL